MMLFLIVLVSLYVAVTLLVLICLCQSAACYEEEKELINACQTL